MKKNAIVILFPEENYLGTRRGCIPLFNKCIQERYLNQGFDLVVVRYKGYRGEYTGGIINIPVNKIIDADITSMEQLERYADFASVAKEIGTEGYGKIVVGGFHCFDCVAKLAKEIYKSNKNVIIDTDLTEQFDFVSKYYKNWEISRFKPELKIEDARRSFGHDSIDLFEKIVDRYKHPVWGISQEYIETSKQDLRLNFLEQNKNENIK